MTAKSTQTVWGAFKQN